MLFLLSTGEPLLPVNRDDDLVDGPSICQAASWTDEQLRRKIASAPIEGDQARLVRDLLKLVLRREPGERASLQSIIEHPFFTGVETARLLSEAAAEWDVFLSYRVDSDSGTAQLLYRLLKAKGLRVYLDSECLAAGLDWEVGFCDGLVKSRCFVPIQSRAAIESRFAALNEASYCDNVLLEHRLAVELQRTCSAGVCWSASFQSFSGYDGGRLCQVCVYAHSLAVARGPS